MTDREVAKSYAVLGLPPDATFDDLDERYLQLTSYWSSLNVVRSQEVAKRKQKEIDDAYQRLLPHFMEKLKEYPGLAKAEYTIKQVMNGQDRIQFPSTNEDDLWMPPSCSKSPDTDTEEWDYSSPNSSPRFSIQEVCGDIFDAPDRAVIVHAANCQGVWGYGVAAHLKTALPQAHNVYRSHCRQVEKPYDILGTCLLIPPQKEDYSENVQKDQKKSESARTLKPKATIYGKRLWVACLFTSVGYGKASMATNNPGKDPKERILKNTSYALEDLRAQLEVRRLPDDEKPGEIWSVKFNSGAFGVDWEETLQVLENEFQGFERPWFVVNQEAKGKPRRKDDPTDVDEADFDSNVRRGHPKIRLTFNRGRGRTQLPSDGETGEAE